MTKCPIEPYGNNDDVMSSIKRGAVKFVATKNGEELAITFFSNQVVHKTVWDDITSRQPARTLVGGGTCKQMKLFGAQVAFNNSKNQLILVKLKKYLLQYVWH